MTTFKAFMIGLVAGALLAVVVLSQLSNSEIRSVQHLADSLSHHDSVMVAVAHQQNDSIGRLNLVIDQHTAPANAAEEVDSEAEAAADVALAKAQTSRDSLTALLKVKHAADSVEADLRIQRDDAVKKFNNADGERARLLTVVDGLRTSQIDLQHKIDALNATPSLGHWLVHTGLPDLVIAGISYKVGQLSH